MTARSYSHGRPTHWTGKQWIYNSTGLIVLDGDLCPCSKCGLHAVVVPLPDDVDTSKEIRTVCIDECIVEHIKDLWAQGYETLSCCCGHGTQRSSVVIGQHQTAQSIFTEGFFVFELAAGDKGVPVRPRKLFVNR